MPKIYYHNGGAGSSFLIATFMRVAIGGSIIGGLLQGEWYRAVIPTQ